MKAIVCELCGSNDVVKQNGFFVCQHCGTKYSLDEAKKLMAEVKVDTTEQKANWYMLARRARDSNDAESAAKYYDYILQVEPRSWEAAFYSVYFRAMQTKIAYINSAAKSVQNCLQPVFLLITETLNTASERKKAFSEVAYRVEQISSILEANARSVFKSNYESASTSGELMNHYYDQYLERSAAVIDLCGAAGAALEWAIKYVPECKELAMRLYKQCIQYSVDRTANVPSVRNNIENNAIYLKIRQYDPLYQIPAPNRTGFPSMWVGIANQIERKNNSSSGSNGGCYIATSVYGSYDCPQVWVLRRFRDYTLADTWYGRAFIHTYYTISPTLVKWFGQAEWFRNLWKPKLDRMVERLKKQGIADTPYQDRQW